MKQIKTIYEPAPTVRLIKYLQRKLDRIIGKDVINAPMKNAPIQFLNAPFIEALPRRISDATKETKKIEFTNFKFCI